MSAPESAAAWNKFLASVGRPMQSSVCPWRSRTGARPINEPGGDPEGLSDVEAPRDWLAAEEAVLASLIGAGASMFATDRRLVIVRSGAGFRPRTGIRSWPYDRIVEVSLSGSTRGQALILVRTGRLPWQAVSMFLDSRQRPDAQRLIDQIRDRM